MEENYSITLNVLHKRTYFYPFLDRIVSSLFEKFFAFSIAFSIFFNHRNVSQLTKLVSGFADPLKTNGDDAFDSACHNCFFGCPDKLKKAIEAEVEGKEEIDPNKTIKRAKGKRFWRRKENNRKPDDKIITMPEG